MTRICGGVQAHAGDHSRRRKRPVVHSAASSRSFASVPALLVSALLAMSAPGHAVEAISLTSINQAIGVGERAAPVVKTRFEDDSAFAALRDYAQGLAPGEASAAAAPGADHDDYAALRAYARGLGEEPRAPAALDADRPRLAQSDILMDTLRNLFHKDDANKDDANPAPPQVPPAYAQAPAKPVPASTKKPVKAVEVEATYVGDKACLGCHATQAAAFGETLMGRINKQHPGKFACENCHGPGSAHVRAGGGRGVGGINSFRSNDPNHTAAENNAICLGCHERGDRTYWSGSTHETRGLQCSDCHNVMRNVSEKHNLKTAWELDTCFQCHKDRRAQLYRTGHMPMREGKMVCSDCHNPHGSMTEAMLRGDSINDVCYKCHAEKRGPFLFEHLPVRENCDNCHDPHGSVNEAMLKMSRPRLCAECHTFDHGPQINGGPNVVFAFGRACNNCHTQVHGSNSPSGALLLR
jgi:DmsE family decaheme c-type cytochrome